MSSIVNAYGGRKKIPTSAVANTQNATNASPECQNHRLSPVTFSNLVKHHAHTNPSTTVKKNGGK
jgi:hypothetical protein